MEDSRSFSFENYPTLFIQIKYYYQVAVHQAPLEPIKVFELVR